MLIDNKGKLFGKVSIIDVLIVLVLVGAVAGLGFKFTKSKTVSPFVKSDDIEIVFYGEEVPDFTANTIKAGDTSKDPVKNAMMGTVKDIKIGKSVSWASNSAGQTVYSSREGYNSIYITTDVKGIYSKNGVTIDNADYYIGQTINLLVGNTAFYIKIQDIRKKG